MNSWQSRRARGLSLLELLVAMAILAVSLTLLYRVDAGVVRGVTDIQVQQRALLLAQSLLDARDAVPAAGWAEQGKAADLEWSVRSQAVTLPGGIAEATPLLHRVEFTVRWTGRDGPRELGLATLLPQETPRPAGQMP